MLAGESSLKGTPAGAMEMDTFEKAPAGGLHGRRSHDVTK
jgi:hypothetical protein